MDGFELCCKLAEMIARSGWTSSLNPAVRELVEVADENGIEICFDDAWISVDDEVFYISE